MTSRKTHRCFQLFVVCCLLELFALLRGWNIFCEYVFGASERRGRGFTNTSMWGISRGRQRESNLSCEWWKRSMPVNVLAPQPLTVCSYCNSGLLFMGSITTCNNLASYIWNTLLATSIFLANILLPFYLSFLLTLACWFPPILHVLPFDNVMCALTLCLLCIYKRMYDLVLVYVREERRAWPVVWTF